MSLRPLGDGAMLSVLRGSFDSSSPRSLVVPDLLSDDDAAALRERVDAAGFSSYFLADRGRYHIQRTHREPALFAALHEAASQLTGASLDPGPARWLRLAHGDYSLFKGDDAREEPARHLELTLDFSAASTGEAGIIYADGGRAGVAIPQQHCSLAIVERAPALLRYERHLTHRVGDARVHRLRLTLYYAPRS